MDVWDDEGEEGIILSTASTNLHDCISQGTRFRFWVPRDYYSNRNLYGTVSQGTARCHTERLLGSHTLFCIQTGEEFLRWWLGRCVPGQVDLH